MAQVLATTLRTAAISENRLDWHVLRQMCDAVRPCDPRASGDLVGNCGRSLSMLFNSYVFWAFFLAVFLLYRFLGHRRQNLMLLVASLYFYGCWDWRFLSLVILSTIIDYSAALGIQNAQSTKRRKLILSVSMVSNLGLLGVFKYYGFFADGLSQLFTAIGIPALMPTMNIVLPVGISFYTFQTMSYAIDVYRGHCPATRRFLDFALY